MIPFWSGLLALIVTLGLTSSEDPLVDEAVTSKPEWDDRGYIMFCPCMGGFGNQVQHYLGTLAFAKAMDRTLVLPPFRGRAASPFTDYFRVDALRQYHRVITMEDFMTYFAADKWPPGERRGYCGKSCLLKDPEKHLYKFWEEQGIKFDSYEQFLFSKYRTDITEGEKIKNNKKNQFDERFPASEHPVMALDWPPAVYPMRPQHRPIQKYFKWNPVFLARAEDEMGRMFHGEKFVGIHLRTGSDMVTVCNSAVGSPRSMASPQCSSLLLGGNITQDMCYPSVDHIVSLTTEAVERYSARHVYIATDKLTYSNELSAALGPHGVKVHHLDPLLPQTDLLILGRSDFFIGNCVSSFTSFVKRERDANDKPSTFWGFPVS